MEFFIAEEGVPLNLGPDGGSIAYFGSEIDFQYETEAPHGDGIFSAKLPHGQYASLGQWYNTVIIEEKGIRLHNDFDGSSFFLENPKELQWKEI